METSSVMRFPVYEVIPEQLRRYVTNNNTTLFYRLKSLKVDDHQLTARAQLQWVDIVSAEDFLTSYFNLWDLPILLFSNFRSLRTSKPSIQLT
ncbi:hypothetical protein OESDEN_14125 [Oesophagostomum dentatum]|uniref:Uncharacterized protein n=1 Tax=Oesophagostomum dentatum TaxID=61180 RepID=A0A0B1SLH1_OESDE|nr:hypothetical protein OESDEN_14125 [Oesophagostomum dentatum]